MSLTATDITSLLGPVDDTLMAEILVVDPSADELVEARFWIENDEALLAAHRPGPTGKVSRLIELLAQDLEEEDASAAGSVRAHEVS